MEEVGEEDDEVEEGEYVFKCMYSAWHTQNSFLERPCLKVNKSTKNHWNNTRFSINVKISN